MVDNVLRLIFVCTEKRTSVSLLHLDLKTLKPWVCARTPDIKPRMHHHPSFGCCLSLCWIPATSLALWQPGFLYMTQMAPDWSPLLMQLQQGNFCVCLPSQHSCSIKILLMATVSAEIVLVPNVLF